MKRVRKDLSRAFTLIEVLVVVAIIALLISILLPSLSRAREQAKAASCLAQMHQMGLGFSAYSSDTKKGFLPWAASFRYSLMAGKFYWPAAAGDPPSGDSGSTFLPCNIGGLYPRYVARQARLFYCPSNKQAVPESVTNGIPRLQELTRNPSGHTGGDGPHNDPGACPIGAYVYARPATTGQHPRDAGTKMYPDSVLCPDIMDYRADGAVSDWLVPISKQGRMRMPMPAFVTDAYFGGFEGAHLGGYNVLYADFHGRKVNDLQNKIHNAQLTSGKEYTTSGGMNGTTGKIYQAWDYFSTHP